MWQIYVTWDKLEFAPQAAGTVSSSFTSCLLGFKVNSDSGPLTVPCAPLPTAAIGLQAGSKGRRELDFNAFSQNKHNHQA